MIGGVATAAAVRTWPFRVYSFPSELRFLSIDELKRVYIERAMNSLLAEARDDIWISSWSVPTLQRLSTDSAFERLELQILRTNAESGPWER